ncbi:MAG: molybdenum cofactor guanylyltransferase [Ignavibacteriae bacterium]|nr:molybdenum cofactor guanylyltransferase [Ignavibacteriota bacterium]MCB9215051.1 molybdenum cofactor guanylyltransferase [Ignavibacteria bacterium]
MLTIAILAGGESRRMGQDKALLQWNGESLLERTVRTAKSTGEPVLVVGRSEPEGWPFAEVQFATDAYPRIGPLGGLETALTLSGSDICLISCDLPLLSVEALRWLISHAPHDTDTHGLICKNQGRLEPLFSLYSSACLPLIGRQRQDQDYALRNLLGRGNFAYADLPLNFWQDLTNVNNPQDWQRLTKR